MNSKIERHGVIKVIRTDSTNIKEKLIISEEVNFPGSWRFAFKTEQNLDTLSTYMLALLRPQYMPAIWQDIKTAVKNKEEGL